MILEKTVKQKCEEAIHLKHSKRLVWELFQQYEDEYEVVKNPTPDRHNEYLNLYFKYVAYMTEKQR